MITKLKLSARQEAEKLARENHALEQALQAAEMQLGKASQAKPKSTAWSRLDGASPDDREAWIISYADLMTLMLTLFVLLVAHATFEPDRFNRSVELDVGAHPGESIEQGGDGERFGESLVDLGIGQGESLAPASAGQDRVALFKSALEQVDLGEDVRVNIEDKRVTLDINSRLLFPVGGTRIPPEGYAVLNEIGNLLARNDFPVSIEGHTDDVPIASLRFPSNWELSAARASKVLRYLIETGIAPERLQAVGYADTRPVAANDTAVGRAANRRVEMVIKLQTPGEADKTPSWAGQ